MNTNPKITDTESAIQGMNKMFYYAMNIPFVKTSYSMPWNDKIIEEYLPDFVSGVDWACDTAHIVGLWKDADEQGGYFGKFMAFYSYLDNTSRRLLLEYITCTYNGECIIK